jgi:putative hemolysin
MDGLWLPLLVVCSLIAVSGVFSGTEMALVTMSRPRLAAMAASGPRGAKIAALAAEPNRFLSAIQVGSVTAGFFSAAFGADRIGAFITPSLQKLGLSEYVANTVAVIGITLLITYLALVFAELAPRRLAMQRPERIALLFGPMVDRFARLMRPAIRLLSFSTNAVVRALGGDPAAGREQLSVAELRDMVVAHDELGAQARRIVDDVFRAGERRLVEIVRPRQDVDFLQASMTVGDAVEFVAEHRHSRYPVIDGTPDDVVGFLHVMDLVTPALVDPRSAIGELVREVLFLPTAQPLLTALEQLQQNSAQLAIVVDEFGGTAGIVTMEDLVEQLVGDITDEYDAPRSSLATDAEQWTVDGTLSVGELERLTGVTLPDGPYETVSGLLVECLGRLPRHGDAADAAGLRLTATEVAGRRVRTMRVERVEATTVADLGQR